MFGPNAADKYALAATKNLDLGCDSQQCSSGNFCITNPSFISKLLQKNDTETAIQSSVLG